MHNSSIELAKLYWTPGAGHLYPEVSDSCNPLLIALLYIQQYLLKYATSVSLIVSGCREQSS